MNELNENYSMNELNETYNMMPDPPIGGGGSNPPPDAIISDPDQENKPVTPEDA